MGESGRALAIPQRGTLRKARTEQSEQVEREFADTIDVGGHERHDLRFAREVVLVALLVLGLAVAVCDSTVVRRVTLRAGARRRGNVLAHERLRIQDGVQLHLEADLQGRRRERPQLSGNCTHSQQSRPQRERTATC